MNILVVSENFYGGGWDKTSAQYVKALSRFGDVTYLCSTPTKSCVPKLSNPFKCIEIPFKTKESVYYQSSKLTTGIAASFWLKLTCRFDAFWYLKGIRDSLEVLREKHYEFCYVINGGYPGSTLCLSFLVACKLANTKSILVVLSIPRSYPVSVWRLFVNRISWLSSDNIITNAAKSKQLLNQGSGAPLEKVSVIYNGIPDTSRSLSCDRAKLARRKNIKIGVISRIDAEKGHSTLLQAFFLLCQELDNCELHIYGDGPYRHHLKELLLTSRYNDRVFLRGSYTSDVSKILEELDIYAFPSLWEAFPYSLLEAMRSGCGIVSTDVGGISEILKDGYNAILVKPKCIDSLAKSLKRLAKDETLRRTLGEQARYDYQQSFKESHMLQSIRSFHLQHMDSRLYKLGRD